MAPCKVLYGRPCRSQVCWCEVKERTLLGSELVEQTIENIKTIRQHLITAQSQQKSDADRQRRPLEFEVASYGFL